MARQVSPPRTPEEQEAKFRELILYIALRNEDDPEFGATRLYKALFYADFDAYVETGQSITGHKYIKGPHGPMPDRAAEIIAELVANGDVANERRIRNGHLQKRTIALREPNLDLFTAREIAVVERVLETQRGMTATGVRELSHREVVGWQVAREGEVIPYESSWISPRKLTPEEIAHGLHLAANG